MVVVGGGRWGMPSLNGGQPNLLPFGNYPNHLAIQLTEGMMTLASVNPILTFDYPIVRSLFLKYSLID